MRTIILGISAAIIAFAAANTRVEAKAAQCRDASGHFTKCVASAPAATPAPASVPPKARATTKSVTTTSHASTPAGATTTRSTGAVKHCSKGKPCGNTCISVNDVCHK